MFLKFSVINVSSNDHALVVHFHLCSANGNRTSDGHYLHLNQIAKQMNRIGKMFFVHLLMCCGSVIVCLHKVDFYQCHCVESHLNCLIV